MENRPRYVRKVAGSRNVSAVFEKAVADLGGWHIATIPFAYRDDPGRLLSAVCELGSWYWTGPFMNDALFERRVYAANVSISDGVANQRFGIALLERASLSWSRRMTLRMMLDGLPVRVYLDSFSMDLAKKMKELDTMYLGSDVEGLQRMGRV